MFESFLSDLAAEPVWTTVGFVGQATFGGRFILQWIVSEYRKRSHVPTAFWFMSLIGSLVLLVYSIHRREPIFVLGFSINTLIYVRNIHLIYKHKNASGETPLERQLD